MKSYLVTLVLLLGLLLTSCGAAATEAPPATDGLIPEATEESSATESPAATETPLPREVSGDVVILVVDDFTPPVEEIKYEEGTNCIVKPDGQIYGSTGTGVGDEFPTDPTGTVQISHGASVYNDIVDQLGSASPDLVDQPIADPSLPWMRQISSWDTGEGKLILVGVDTLGYTTTTVTSSISSAVDLLSRDGGMNVQLSDSESLHINQVQQFVINMSFAVVPCDTLAMTLEEYNDLIEDDPNDPADPFDQDLIDFRDQLSTAVADSGTSLPADPETEKQVVLMRYRYDLYDSGDKFQGDELHTFLIEFPKEGSDIHVIPVASAGNKGQYFEYPFAPAIWDFVISVSSEGSASNVEGYVPLNLDVCPSLGIAEYSNCGEIKMDGQSFSNTGTSYAAPKFSYKMALYLMDNAFSQCTGPNNTALTVFGYAEDTGDWLNFGFDDAFNDFCVLGTPTP